MYDGYDRYEEIFTKLKIQKGACVKNSLFIGFMLTAAIFAALAAVLAKTPYADYGWVFGIFSPVWAGVGLLALIASAVENKLARGRCEEQIYEYGIYNIYNDINDAEMFLNGCLYIGKDFVYIPQNMIKLSDAKGFESETIWFTIRYWHRLFPIAYRIHILYYKNGREKKALVGKLDYSMHERQFEAVSKKLRKVKKLYPKGEII
ncbi:MAG: hypothetical protein IKS17_03215 [Firmicutes bacterium]|nr:hypothetical protein [Bacillota bacterium]